MLEGLHGYKSKCQRRGRGACGDARQPKRSGKSGSRVRALPLKSTTFDRCLPPIVWIPMLLMVPSTQARREPRPRPRLKSRGWPYKQIINSGKNLKSVEFDNCHCFSWRRASHAVGRASKFPEARYNAITARRRARGGLSSRCPRNTWLSK